MTVKEFFKSKEALAIHCKTKAQAIKLLKAFDREGYKWFTGISYLSETYWNVYKGEICYSNRNQFADRESYQDLDYKILEFEDIEL